MTNLHKYLSEIAVRRYGALQKPEELEWLLDQLLVIHKGIIIEIGCDAGGTLYVWNRIVPVVLGIDLPGGPYSTGRPLTSHGATLFLGDSHDARIASAAEGFLAGEKADMLFIDGDHTYEGVMLDFQMYSPLIRPGGAIVFQDIRDHHREDVGVHRLWKAIKETAPSRCVEYMHGPDDWAGIGILWQKDDES